MSDPLRFAKRAEVEGLLAAARRQEFEGMTKEQLIDLLVGTTRRDRSRTRNYELEMDLQSVLGDEWCISESCPFNGDHCRWGSIQSGKEMHEPTPTTPIRQP